MILFPKYKQIIDELEADINSGRFKPGAKLPSEAALVKRFNTSRITVGRALHELQTAGMIDRVGGSGSFVRLRKEALRDGLVFGLLIPDLGEVEVLDAICQGIANAPGSDHALLWGHSSRDEESKEQRALELCAQFIRRKISGVFFAPLEFELTADKTNRKLIAMLQEANIPVVLLDRRAAQQSERTRLDMVGINNWQAGYVATEHLIKAGARHIGFMGYHAAASTVTGRMAGYQDALRDYGLPLEPMDVTEQDMAEQNGQIEAFVCVNDRVAAQLMQSLINGGTKVPEDVRITGIDDASFASLLPVPLTTVRQPCRDIGEAALRTMLDRIDRPKGPTRELLLDGMLVVRRSA